VAKGTELVRHHGNGTSPLVEKTEQFAPTSSRGLAREMIPFWQHPHVLNDEVTRVAGGLLRITSRPAARSP